MSDFDISGVLRIDTTDLQAMENRVSTATKRIVGLLAGAFAVDKIRDWGQAGLKAAGDYEQTEIAFTSLLGSAEKAKTFMTDMRKFVKETPFEFPGMADASRKLLGYGFDMKSIIPIMTDIGNVASSLGVSEDGINGFVRAIGQMRGKGKVSADEIRQISENIPGFNAAATIAASKGISVAATYDLMQKGAIGAEEGIAAIMKGMKNYPGAAGAMEAQNRTLLGSMNMLKETIRFAAVDVFEPFMPAITKSLRNSASTIQNTVVPTLISASKSIFAAFGQITAGFSGAEVDDKDNPFYRIGQFASQAVDMIQKYGPPLKAWFERELLPPLMKVGSFIGDNLVPILTGLGVAFGSLAVASIVTTAIAGIGAVVAAIASPIALFVVGIAALVAGLVYAYQHSETFRDVVGKVVAFVTEQFGNLVAFGKDIWPQLSEAISHVMNVIRDVVTVVLDVLKAGWAVFGDDILKIVSGAFHLIKAVVETVIGVIANIIRLVLAVINGDWGKAWEAIKDIVVGVWNGLFEVVRGALRIISGILGAGYEILKSAATGVFNAITDSLKTVLGGMYSVGESIVGGIIDGLKAAGNKLKETMGVLIDMLPQFVKDALGIRSPSRVFMELGKQIPAGMAKGIASGTGEVTAAMGALTDVGSVNFGMGALPMPAGASAAAGGSSITVGDIHIHGVTDADSVRGVIPELVGALRAGVGKA